MFVNGGAAIGYYLEITMTMVFSYQEYLSKEFWYPVFLIAILFPKRGYPDIENNSGLGESLIINDKRYYVMTYGNYRIGDKVRVFFLPKSKYVLKIEKAN